MSLTAFQRVRRMQQVEEMKPENILKQEVKEEPKIIEPSIKEEVNEEVKEAPKSTSSRRRTTAKRK